MNKLTLVIVLFVLLGCKKEQIIETPIADTYVSESDFANANCGGLFNDDCRDYYWAQFIVKLTAYYELKFSNASKFCLVNPDYCVDLKTTELLFQSQSPQNPFNDPQTLISKPK